MQPAIRATVQQTETVYCQRCSVSSFHNKQGCKHSAHCTKSIFPGKTTFERSRISCACIIGSSIQNLCEIQSAFDLHS